MFQHIFFVSLCLVATCTKSHGNIFSKPDEFIRQLKQYADVTSRMVACKSNHDCIDGFFCKNNDCIAKRSEGSLCLSSENYECMCGKCTLNSGTWNKVCLSDYEDGECSNGGSNPFNNCKSNDECPRGYFCDIIDGKVCSSKLAAGRLCFNDEMCACGKCAETSHISRPNKPPIKFNVCNSC